MLGRRGMSVCACVSVLLRQSVDWRARGAMLLQYCVLLQYFQQTRETNGRFFFDENEICEKIATPLSKALS